MSDLYHYIGGDLGVSSDGDLLLTGDDTTEGDQRLLRRLLTNSALIDATGSVSATGDYAWHQDYGAGLGREVGNTLDVSRIRGLIRTQIFNEQIVAHSPEPTIDVRQIDSGLSVSIKYFDSTTGRPASLAFDITQ